ncbi:phenylacetate--CoA ligase family protein [Colwellia sp. MB3u-70]|uniref:phenylacetate--CoA ligase family protein n=1 Tax=unclassified Colwellia TaxID=196834 RepID=UPI0015F64AFB|nr:MULTISPECIES: phenylacetate--CoA ligase family protein [unclassified Colwellia]MBA6294076.1 phenylacetate--CoA ligase family protein [Colwellia sp. MB3u-8]MBA6307617.1 phenylacetate--CoA ligase family protein [Colwellia sp. MB3u-70]
MPFYPSLLQKLLMPLYEKIKGKNLLFYLNAYESHLTWSSEQLKSHQWNEVKKLLIHAFDNTTFYPEMWAKAGIDSIDDIQNMNDFEKLPLVSKDDITKHYQGLVAKNYANNIKKATGGSTGQLFRFELNTDSNTRREAIMWRGYGWLDAGLGQKTLYLWGADIGQPTKLKTLKNNLYHAFYNRKMLNSFAMNTHNMPSYVEEINNYRPTALVSYVNPLYVLARFIIEHNISVFSPKTILTGAEPLYEFQRKIIEKAFNCEVYDTFGCREFMLMSAECQAYKNLHINSDHLVVETVNDTGQSITGESGDLVVTDLYNYGMPLIRYINGDRATLTDQPCGCENPLPIMSSIDGRKLDIIKTASGKLIPGELFPHLFKEFIGIDKFQIKQNEISSLQILLITNKHFTEQNKDDIAKEINKYAENELQLVFNMVDDIPLTASGKNRVTICEV